MTKTTYQVESHNYTELVPCTNPTTCTKRSHWDVSAEVDTREETTVWIEVNDAPAVRVVEITEEA